MSPGYVEVRRAVRAHQERQRHRFAHMPGSVRHERGRLHGDQHGHRQRQLVSQYSSRTYQGLRPPSRHRFGPGGRTIFFTRSSLHAPPHLRHPVRSHRRPVPGSFLNVVAYRLPQARRWSARPRRARTAASPSAGATTFPVLSWLMLGGHCRACDTSISPRYPLTEARPARYSSPSSSPGARPTRLARSHLRGRARRHHPH